MDQTLMSNSKLLSSDYSFRARKVKYLRWQHFLSFTHSDLCNSLDDMSHD